ncbi:MAG: GGDEF domain-containing protein [Peptostreptococcaceae bacterium]|nr:GGDEF domain-containing protein [Peptostreptococcaceae bacterium]
MRRFEKIKYLNIILGIVAVILSIAGIVEAVMSDHVTATLSRGVVSYSQKWQLDVEHMTQEIDLPITVAPHRYKATIRRRVDNAISYYGGMAFATKDQLVKVYVNGRLIYSLDRDRGSKLATIGGEVWNFIDLRGKASVGDVIRIDISNLQNLILDDEESKTLLQSVAPIERTIGEYLHEQKHMPHFSKTIKIKDIYLASRQDMFSYIFTREAFSLAIGAVIATMGFIVAFFGFLPYRNIGNHQHLKYLGLSTIFMGLAEMASNGVLRYIFYDAAMLDQIYGMSKLLAGFSFGFYMLKSKVVNCRAIIFTEMALIALFIAVKISGYLFGVGILLDLLISEKVLIILFVIFNLLLLMVESKEGKPSSNNLIFGYFVLLVFLLLSRMQENMNLRHAALLEAVGVALFFFILILKELRFYSELYEKGQSMEYYKELAGRDNLTALKNRTSFMEDLVEYQADFMSLTVIAFDADNLKLTNDTLGHSKGDELLQTVASTLFDNFSDIGECYRMSGDEFLCVLKNVDRSIVEKRIRLVEQQMNMQSQKRGFTVSSSCGVAYYDSILDHRFEDLMNRADNALYMDKKRKKEEQVRY